MPDEQPTPAPESAAPVVTDSSPTPADTGLPGVPALFADHGNGTGDAPSAPSEPAAEPASDEVLEAAQEPESEGDTEPEVAGEPKMSRAQREAARRQAEVNEAVQAALTAREQAAQAQAALAARNAEDQRVMERAAELMGGSEDENALIDAVANGDFEAADRLKDLRKRRADSAVIVTAADRMAWAKVYDQIQTAREIPGVETAFLAKVGSIPEIFTHIAEVTAKRVETEWSGKLERQKADYESRLGRAASQLPTTETGGRAVGQATHIFTRAELARMSTADYKKFKSEIREQEARGLIS